MVRIRGNGNVGIGTNNPGARIHVNGNSIFSGTVRISGGAPAV